jgi:hypothetical protein
MEKYIQKTNATDIAILKRQHLKIVSKKALRIHLFGF